MSQVNPPTVDEWFLSKQLKAINKGLHLPFKMKSDVTVFAKHYRDQNKRPPYTALLVKAASQLIHEMPEINRACFHTFYGLRLVNPNYNAVNLPLMVEIDGKSVVTGITIEDAYKKSCEQIREEIKSKRPTSFDRIPLNKIIHCGRFKLWQKLKLRMLLFLFSNLPKLYLKKGGGGISVSSLLNLAQKNNIVEMSAYGMTTLTISSCSIETNDESDTHKICVGVAFDHLVTHGAIGTGAIIRLNEIIGELARSSVKN